LGTETKPYAAAPSSPALASLGHTAALVALMVAVAITGTLLQHSGAPAAAAAIRASSSRIWGQYLPLLAVNALLVLYVARLFRPRNVLRELIGRTFGSAADVLLDLACAALFFALIVALEAHARSSFPGRNAAVAALLPSTGAERLTWALVAASVGFCEEVVYRGYLQTQISAFTRSALAGLVLQAALFGLGHLEQGLGAASRIGAYGLLLGALARSRGSLLPSIACHIGIDLASGLAR
jgi:CAAX protease family protein